MMSASTGRTGATCGGSAVTRVERRAAACVLVAAAAAFTAPADAATPYRFVGRPIAIVAFVRRRGLPGALPAHPAPPGRPAGSRRGRGARRRRRGRARGALRRAVATLLCRRDRRRLRRAGTARGGAGAARPARRADRARAPCARRPRHAALDARGRGRATRLRDRPLTTEARYRGLRSSEDRASCIGEGTFVEGLSLWLPSLSDSPCIGGPGTRLERDVGIEHRRRARCAAAGTFKTGARAVRHHRAVSERRERPWPDSRCDWDG